MGFSPVTYAAAKKVAEDALTGAGALKGQKGDPGANGKDGANGKSAYEIAVADGFTGTEKEWLASLVGPKGDTGATGEAGPKGQTGSTGEKGATGATGRSAYEIAVANGFTGTEAEWIGSLKGKQGDKGETGKDGADGKSFTIQAQYATEAELKAAHPTGNAGDAYYVGENTASSRPDVYIWLAESNEWYNQGPISGVKGDDGASGKSAYELAEENGYSGSESEWLASLKGAKGDKGDTGAGVPNGGTTGQILTKKSNDDQDTEWTDPGEADLPAGGTTGQVLTKKSNDDGDVEWSTPAGIGTADEIADIVNVYGAKNLMETKASSHTQNGITKTVNADGSFTLNGTATKNTYFYWMGQTEFPTENIQYTYSIETSAVWGIGQAIAGIDKRSETAYIDRYKSIYADGTTHIEGTFTGESGYYAWAWIFIPNGTQLTNVIVKGMIRLASIKDDTYQPYAMTNRELTEFAINKMGRQLPLVNLGTEYTAELKADISSGKFEKAVVGGYLTINGHVYYFAHPDYWLHTGDTECTTHHMLVIPAGNIETGKMNDTNITTGGYAGSDFKTGNNSNTALATARAQIIADFGASNILTHRELFANAATDGKASEWVWADSDIDLMNEVMVYGCNVWASAPGYETGIDKCQLKLFQERPDLITTRAHWWLRSVVSASHFAFVTDNGVAGGGNASSALGVRPAFAIC